MAVNQMQRKVYYHMTTTNKTFLDMHRYLKDIGIKNNKFMLVLLDPDLAGIDPHDPKLPTFMKQKVLRECMCNYWYFLRECVRIPSSKPGGDKFRLDRANMAVTFCQALNLNIFLEEPRQMGKTIGLIVRYLYLFNFGTKNSEMAFLNKRMDDSKLNLQRFKDIRDALPPYLQMKQQFNMDGKAVRSPNTVESVQHPINNNRIKVYPSARNKVAAASLLRGRTLPLIWFDEYAFIPFNNIIYTNGAPAFKTASMNAKMNGTPYGITITTTPGFLTEDEGIEAYQLKEAATPFSEMWYDMPYNELMTLIDANTKSNFIYIKFTYQQLGRDESWFRDICRDLRMQWTDIRREVLLEWSNSVENSPFRPEDLEIISQLVKKPIRQVLFLGKYLFNIYEEVDLRYPPIIGVDVSGGFNRDSSAVTCIDSRTTKVFADFNCNYIPTHDLAQLIYELVSKYMPSAVVNVERNGGYGASVLGKLVGSPIKKNLYYEIKDKVLEERQQGTKVIKRTQPTKVYGLDSTKSVRELLIQILRERVEYHKDKFVSETIYQELIGMEVKRNGRVDHSANTHDDQTFSMLMALYVWYEGKDLMSRFGIQKGTIRTDEDIDEVVLGGFEERYGDILEEIENLESSSELNEQLKEMNRAAGTLFEDWMKSEWAKDQAAYQELMNNKVTRKAMAEAKGIPADAITESGFYTLPDSIYNNFYDE